MAIVVMVRSRQTPRPDCATDVAESALIPPAMIQSCIHCTQLPLRKAEIYHALRRTREYARVRCDRIACLTSCCIGQEEKVVFRVQRWLSIWPTCRDIRPDLVDCRFSPFLLVRRYLDRSHGCCAWTLRSTPRDRVTTTPRSWAR